MVRAYLKQPVKAGTNTLLPKMQEVLVDMDKNPDGNLAQVQLPSTHPKHPGAMTIIPKKLLALDIPYLRVPCMTIKKEKGKYALL